MAIIISNAFITKLQMVSDNKFNIFEDLSATAAIISGSNLGGGGSSSFSFTTPSALLDTFGNELDFSTDTDSEINTYFCTNGDFGTGYSGGPDVLTITKGDGNTDPQRPEVGDVVTFTSDNSLSSNQVFIFFPNNILVGTFEGETKIVRTDANAVITSVHNIVCP